MLTTCFRMLWDSGLTNRQRWMPFMMCFAGYVSAKEKCRRYLLRALRNQLIDTYKLKRNYSEVLTGEITDELPYKIKITVEDEIIAAEEQAEVSQKVDEILSILTERQREIIYLRYMQECSYEEIAEIMQISVPACRKLLYRTLLKLKHNNTLVLFYLLLSINVG